MKYSETFQSQWDRLVEDFRINFNGVSPAAMDQQRLAKWYRSNTYRWASMVEPEARILGEQDRGLREELTDAMGTFRFSAVELPKKPNVPIPAAVGAAVAVCAGLVLWHFKRLFWWTALLDAVICLVAVLAYIASSLDRYEKSSRKAVMDGYASQLDAFGGSLVDICLRHENG